MTRKVFRSVVFHRRFAFNFQFFANFSSNSEETQDNVKNEMSSIIASKRDKLIDLSEVEKDFSVTSDNENHEKTRLNDENIRKLFSRFRQEAHISKNAISFVSNRENIWINDKFKMRTKFFRFLRRSLNQNSKLRKHFRTRRINKIWKKFRFSSFRKTHCLFNFNNLWMFWRNYNLKLLRYMTKKKRISKIINFNSIISISFTMFFSSFRRAFVSDRAFVFDIFETLSHQRVDLLLSDFVMIFEIWTKTTNFIRVIYNSFLEIFRLLSSLNILKKLFEILDILKIRFRAQFSLLSLRFQKIKIEKKQEFSL